MARHRAAVVDGSVQLTVGDLDGEDEARFSHLTADEACRLALDLLSRASWLDPFERPWGDLSAVVAELLAERDRQRERQSDEHDDQKSDAEWRRLHVEHLLRAFPKRRGCDKLASREHLVRAMAGFAAHIETIDRKAEAEREEASWLLLRPTRYPSGEYVWAVVRMPEDTVCGHLDPYEASPAPIGPPHVSDAEADTLRTAWNEARNEEMDITLQYRIDGDEIGPG